MKYYLKYIYIFIHLSIFCTRLACSGLWGVQSLLQKLWIKSRENIWIYTPLCSTPMYVNFYVNSFHWRISVDHTDILWLPLRFQLKTWCLWFNAQRVNMVSMPPFDVFQGVPWMWASRGVTRASMQQMVWWVPFWPIKLVRGPTPKSSFHSYH